MLAEKVTLIWGQNGQDQQLCAPWPMVDWYVRGMLATELMMYLVDTVDVGKWDIATQIGAAR